MHARLRRPLLASFGLALLVAVAVPLTASLAGTGKGSDIGGPPHDDDSQPKRFGIDPATLTDEEKLARLEIVQKEYDTLRKNQDVIQTRTRRNRVKFVGEMRFQPAAKWLMKVFEKDRDTRVRVTALIAIGQSGDLDIIQAATKKSVSMAKKNPVFATSLPRMFDTVQVPAAGEWLIGRLKVKDDDVKASLIEAVGLTGTPKAVPVIEKMLTQETDIRVRFELLRAYGRCGGEQAVSTLLTKVNDEDWRIRMAAAEGLQYAGEPRAIPQLENLIIEGEEQVVIETATQAAGHLGGKEAIPLLLETLRVGRLRARYMARDHLVRLARELYRQDKDYHIDFHSWNSWWKKVKRGVDPDDPSLKVSETASYFRFKIHSDRVLFVLDVSGSMKWPDPPAPSRISLAHKELFTALEALAKQSGKVQKVEKKKKKGETSDGSEDELVDRPVTMFNVATFAGHVTQWQQEVVPANENNVKLAIEWLKKQFPRGGTNTFDALTYGIEKADVDTIFFLSDGVPSVGRFDEPEVILAEVRKANRFKRIAINTVALIVGKTPIEKALKYEDPGEMADFMGRIAAENFGKFADESRP